MTVADSDNRGAPRIRWETEVKVRFQDFEEFVTQHSKNISETGIFLQTTDPQAPGSELVLEFEVEGGTQLIRGLGEVVWARGPKAAQDRPPGMGVRFTSLDAQSRKLIQWLVDKKLARPGAAEP
jgi:uncharacterized protein (TIGR02266 family)